MSAPGEMFSQDKFPAACVILGKVSTLRDYVFGKVAHKLQCRTTGEGCYIVYCDNHWPHGYYVSEASLENATSVVRAPLDGLKRAHFRQRSRLRRRWRRHQRRGAQGLNH